MQQVLVLNFDFTPLNVTSLQRGFILVNNGKAEIIEADSNPIVTTYKEYVRPLIIRLLRYINYRGNGMRVNRQKVFKRDEYQCVYCGSQKELTIDHVQPRSRGGRNTWTNLVTCCSKCNHKKGNKTPEEANMKLRRKPYEPTFVNEHESLTGVWDKVKETFFSFFC
jgi:CRISPR/Cas system Type II protein with McrA/HNH and RuvC-like nuclease domain